MTLPHPPVILGWAAVAAESLRFQEQGMAGEEAWCLAAGVARSRAGAGHPRTLIWPRVAAWVVAQGVPVTSPEVAAALGLETKSASHYLRIAERQGAIAMAGCRFSNRARQILWRAP